MSEINIFHDSCKGVEDCGICIYVCPHNLYEPSEKMNQRGFIPPRMIDETRCVGCLTCMVSCPDMAIVVEKKQKEKEAA